VILCMVSPHLPPDQAANALLPQLLCEGLTELGHEVRLMAFEPREGQPTSSDVHYIRRPRNGWSRKLRLSQMETGFAVWNEAKTAFRNVDVVHIHSNTFMNQVAAALAYRRGLPFVLTHYGTEIWHYRPRRIDPFLWMNHHATHVTYYSKLLMSRSLELGVVPSSPSVVYPPVERRFRPPTADERAAARHDLGGDDGPLLLNVKRLHPLAGQRFLVEAMPAVLEAHPRAKLFIAGEGESRAELEALVVKLGLGDAVVLLGLVAHRDLPRYYQASDLFVLPSRLEAFPTVAAEALASGLRVVSADHPGGLELSDLFPEDVTLVPRERVEPLAEAIIEALRSDRTSAESTRTRIEREFRPEAAVQRYLDLYRSAVEGEAVARD
jgi:glycosyltransferase involved in cell wall biosynthesis